MYQLERQNTEDVQLLRNLLPTHTEILIYASFGSVMRPPIHGDSIAFGNVIPVTLEN